jgi:AcrR family transcriptional regulator
MSTPADVSRSPGRREAEALATRTALIQAATTLFAERGYAEVGTEEIVARAKVTRGALYHHFRDKRDLFRASYRAVEDDLIERIAARMQGARDPFETMTAGMRAFLDGFEDPAVKQVALTDAPVVLGWREWREIGDEHGLGMTRAALQAAVDQGILRPIAVEPMAHLLIAALSEAVFVIANSKHPRKARAEVETALTELLEGLRA